MISHYVMNLPDSAIQFLDAFRCILSFLSSERNLSGHGEIELPMIHCHCFTRELDRDEAEADIRRVSKYLSVRS